LEAVREVLGRGCEKTELHRPFLKEAKTLEQRLKKLMTLMEEHKLDALVASLPENVAYGTNYQSLAHWRHPVRRTYAVIRKDRSPILIMPAGSADAFFRQESQGTDVRTYGDFYVEIGRQPLDQVSSLFLHALEQRKKGAKPIHLLAEALTGCRRIGLDEQRVTGGERDELFSLLPGVETVDAYGIWRQARAVKSEKEIARIEKATRITEEALQEALDVLKLGGTEQEAVIAFRSRVVKEGALPTFIYIGAGFRGAWPNAGGSTHVPRPGEPIRFDLGCIYEGYHSDIARTAIKKPVPEEISVKYEALRVGFEAGLAVIKEGVTPAEVFERVVQSVRQHGIPDYQRHHVGHGEGLEGYDPPLLAPGVQEPLEAGMTLCLETPHYILGQGGLHLEDTIVVTKEGYRSLSTMPRHLIEL
jgi:Xaa-Pro dipeptidase